MRVRDLVRSFAFFDPLLHCFKSLEVLTNNAAPRSRYGEQPGKILRLLKPAHDLFHAFVIFSDLSRRESQAIPGRNYNELAFRFFERPQIGIVAVHVLGRPFDAKFRIAIHVEGFEIPIGILKDHSFEIIDIDGEGFLLDHKVPIQLTSRFKAAVYRGPVFELRSGINLFCSVHLAGGEAGVRIRTLALYARGIKFAFRGIFNEAVLQPVIFVTGCDCGLVQQPWPAECNLDRRLHL